eukprot:c10845_g1_i1.p1 GENE.c10845_g1_i1~~c10845_g1_i1.p1  ORF type:complete len:101 (-),score=22.77 c10845_g1_i1:92-352(-)
MVVKTKAGFFFVQLAYFVTPIVAGYFIMKAVIPSEDQMRKRLQKSAVSHDQRVNTSVNYSNTALQTVLTNVETGKLPSPQDLETRR